MRPDRIIVGETRGEEALDMLQAMGTGHDGSLSTGHANSPKDMLVRLRTMVLMGMSMPAEAIDRQIASAIDIVVHLKRMRDRTRKVVEITEVGDYGEDGFELIPLFSFVEEGEDESGKIIGKLKKTEARLKTQASSFHISEAVPQSRRDYLYYIQGIAIVLAVAYLFYNSFISVIVLCLFIPIYVILRKKKIIRKE